MNPRRTFLWAGIAGTALLAGCAGPQISDYAKQTPTLELDHYFNGRIIAHGVFQKRDGTVARRFTVFMDCHWEGNQGVLDEHFTYSDGSKERRIWRLTKHADGRYTGRADDVVGEATGQTSGNAFRWNYTLRLPVDGSVYEVQFDDWMFLMDERVMLNRATMSKFGIRLGEVLLSFSKV
ncbi:MAG: DUF3833 domain-containing protein [Comamonas sp.]|nr:DUF3833 domain-containing protein [Comamonas sp.]